MVFAWQSGHRPLQRGTVYGLDGAYPSNLQPQLLRAFEWASVKWHEFLRQPSKQCPPLPSQPRYLPIPRLERGSKRPSPSRELEPQPKRTQG